jgi:hypothetical protein
MNLSPISHKNDETVAFGEEIKDQAETPLILKHISDLVSKSPAQEMPTKLTKLTQFNKEIEHEDT